VPLGFNLRRRLGLVGWSRASGPNTSEGAQARASGDVRDATPVVVCVWRRPHRLERTIAALAAQSHGPVRLCLWNNNPSLRDFVDRMAAQERGIHVDVVHSARNVGGFGRFYLARRIADEHGLVVFLDDDQDPAADFLETLLGGFGPRTAASAWGYRFRGRERYADRYPARPGQRVKYCGTRGMVCDTSAFLEPAVFACPKRYWFVEDLWLSYVLDHLLAWPLFRSEAEIGSDADEHDQYRYLGPTKDRLFRYLVRRGWDPRLDDDAPAVATASSDSLAGGHP
jgi:hypothetical protein